MKIQSSENIGHTQRAAGVPRLRLKQHLNYRNTNVIGLFLKRRKISFNFFFGVRHCCYFSTLWNCSIVPLTSSLFRIAEPTTSLLAPLSRSAETLSRLTPPSTLIGLPPYRRRNSRTVPMTIGSKASPWKPTLLIPIH